MEVANFFWYALDVMRDDQLEALANLAYLVWRALCVKVFEGQCWPSKSIGKVTG